MYIHAAHFVSPTLQIALFPCAFWICCSHLLVHRLAYNSDVVRQAPDQLAVFQGASEAPISELIRVERVRRLPDRLRIEFRYAPSYCQSGSDRPAKAGPAAYFERNDDNTTICETVH